jgi:hypothetical protein
MPQDRCQCQSGSHGHEPGECKNAITHEVIRCVTIATIRRSSFSQCSRPANSSDAPAWNRVQRLGVFTKPTAAIQTSASRGEPISSHEAPDLSPRLRLSIQSHIDEGRW